MVSPMWMLGMALTLQVPPPDSATELSAEHRRAYRAILARESAQLNLLADRLSPKDRAEGADVLRSLVQQAAPTGRASRFVPLPEVVSAPAQGRGLANIPAGGEAPASWKTELLAIRQNAAQELFALAEEALTVHPNHYALADVCLRAVLERQPDHPEARRLLGHVPDRGGWATPYALRQLQEKKVRHPTYGWVPASWVPHLEQGELPAPSERGQKQPCWLPAAEADCLHGDWTNRWKIFTEHFEIHANVPLSEAITFGRQLENLHQLFFSVLADVFGPNLPLARRFHNKKMVGEQATRPHIVSYFATRQEFSEFLQPLQGPNIAKSLGLYIPPRPGGPKRVPAYFFRDEKGQLPVTATLHHEVSHQLLFESGLGDPNAFEKNDGNFWVFEGLGTYFETLVTEPDGSLQVGGVVGSRMERAVERLVHGRELIPTAQLVRFDQRGFNEGDVFLKYQEANALTVFLMQAEDAKYREGFLDYVRDAAQGRLKRVTGRSLEDRLGIPHAKIDEELISYLKNAAPMKGD